ncbi:MAG: DUF2339 domain-containing protein [Fimbriimonadales bacterium]|nr:DUF2339 domain-containing protein [Fimbriimonadales bacterium]
MSDDARRELEQIKTQLNTLAYRVRELERRMAVESVAEAKPPVQAAPQKAKATPLESTSQPAPRPAPTTPRTTAPAPLRTETSKNDELQSLERALGGKVALYTGITLVLLSLAFFMGWAWTRLSPEGRLALGYLGGFALIGLGGLARRRSENWFVDGLMGAGLAALYLTTWAGWGRYQLLSFAWAFGATTLVTVLGVALALWRNSQTLAVVATLGGFAAPIWLRGAGEAGSPLNFFGYLTALNLGMLTVGAWREWRAQQAVCLASTLLLMWGWALENYKPEFRLLTLGFITLYYALFSAAYLLPDTLRRQNISEFSLGQFVLATVIYLPAGYALWRETWGDYPGALLASFGGIFILMSWLMYRRQDAPASLTLATLGVICLVAAVSVQFQPAVQVLLYSLFAAALLIVGLRYELRLIYAFGVLIAFGSAIALWVALMQPIRTSLVLLNEHGVGLLGWMAGVSASLYMLNRHLKAQAVSPLDGLFPRSALALMGALGLVLALAWFSAEQTLYAFVLQGKRDAPLAHLLVSLEWTLLGAGLLIGGVQQAIRALRLMGLGLLALTTCKLFLYDLGFLEMPYRALSFAGLGLALIGVAWLYSRFGRTEATA